MEWTFSWAWYRAWHRWHWRKGCPWQELMGQYRAYYQQNEACGWFFHDFFFLHAWLAKNDAASIDQSVQGIRSAWCQLRQNRQHNHGRKNRFIEQKLSNCNRFKGNMREYNIFTFIHNIAIFGHDLEQMNEVKSLFTFNSYCNSR